MVTPDELRERKDAAERAAYVGGDREELYRSVYPWMSWFVHSGVAGLGGVSGKGIDAAFGRAYALVQQFTLDATENIAASLHLCEADPDLRRKIDTVKTVTPQSFLEAMQKALEAEKQASNDG